MNSSTLKRKAPASTAAGGSAKKSRPITSFFAPTGGDSPKPKHGARSNGPKFDKARWTGSLTAEQRELLALEIETMHDSWLAALKDELVTDGFLSLKRFLAAETDKVYPPRKDIYSWTRYCPLNTVKVVILGQDPYHGSNQAMGLSFSVNPPTPAPPSLKNIYVALQNDFASFTAPPGRGGNLVPWAQRGVLLLNTCLTVRAGAANSHADRGWEQLTQRAIEVVARGRGVVFMVWGAPAARRVGAVDKKRHLVLRSPHPSPFSARLGFFDCGHFKKANEWLQERYGDSGPVDWSLHGNTPVGVPKVQEKRGGGKVDVAKKGGEKEKEKEAVDEFGVDDEEAMLEAERAFRSSQVEGEGDVKAKGETKEEGGEGNDEKAEAEKVEAKKAEAEKDNEEEDKEEDNKEEKEEKGEKGEKEEAAEEAETDKKPAPSSSEAATEDVQHEDKNGEDKNGEEGGGAVEEKEDGDGDGKARADLAGRSGGSE